MNPGALADGIVALHFAFVLFVLFGGLLVAWRRRMMWLHLPAAAWGAFVELSGKICPLTPWENALRRQGGAAGYQGGFIDHYITAVLYPRGLTRGTQLLLAVVVVGLNLGIYRWALSRSSPRTPPRTAPRTRSRRGA